MPRRRVAVAPLNEMQFLISEIEDLKRRLALTERARMSSIVTLSDTENMNDPKQGMIAVNALTEGVYYYHDHLWRPLNFPPPYEFLVSPYDRPLTTEHLFWFPIPAVLDGYSMVSAAAGLYIPGSTATTVTVENDTTSQSLMTTNITIDGSERTSYTAAVQPVTNTAQIVSTGDGILTTVLTAGTGAMGLCGILTFGL